MTIIWLMKLILVVFTMSASMRVVDDRGLPTKWADKKQSGLIVVENYSTVIVINK